jgi:plastocyanin
MSVTPRAVSSRNLIIATVLISAIIGSVAGLTANYLARTTPSPESRVFYLFARDLSFNYSLTSGPNQLTSDYGYSANYIVINRGDTLVIHFYNPTDQKHSFTMASPYQNNVTLAQGPTDQNPNNPISDVSITISASQAGTFEFYCIFHQPQMRGFLIVQG